MARESLGENLTLTNNTDQQRKSRNQKDDPSGIELGTCPNPLACMSFCASVSTSLRHAYIPWQLWAYWQQ
jgi:hypothetical protein